MYWSLSPQSNQQTAKIGTGILAVVRPCCYAGNVVVGGNVVVRSRLLVLHGGCQKPLAPPICCKFYMKLHWIAPKLLHLRSFHLLPWPEAWYWQCTLPSLLPIQVTTICLVDIVPRSRHLIETLRLLYKILLTLPKFITNQRLLQPAFHKKYSKTGHNKSTQ